MYIARQLRLRWTEIIYDYGQILRKRSRTSKKKIIHNAWNPKFQPSIKTVSKPEEALTPAETAPEDSVQENGDVVATAPEVITPDPTVHDSRPWAIQLNRPQDIRNGRTRHPNEAPYTKPSQAGNIIFEFRPDEKEKKGVGGYLKWLFGISSNTINHFIDETGEVMKIGDLYEHMIVFGGSGTGKTYSILQPLWEEWFRSTHIPDEGVHQIQIYAGQPPVKMTREKLKFGALVIEAKGDFKDKTWRLGQKYGRMDDCVFFGPTHKFTYDVFGDPTESAMQKANKMGAILKAYSDGKAGNTDPFWDNASQKLFINIFILHDTLRDAYRNAQTEEDKKFFEVPPMSWDVLNLLLMDRGQPKNQGEIEGQVQAIARHWGNYNQELQQLLTITTRLEMHIEWLTQQLAKADRELGEASKELDEKLKNALAGVTTDDSWRTDIPTQRQLIANRQNRLKGLKELMEGNASDIQRTFAAKCSALRNSIGEMLKSENDSKNAENSNISAEISNTLAYLMRQTVSLIDHLGDKEKPVDRSIGEKIQEDMLNFIGATERSLNARLKLTNIKTITPSFGALKLMLKQYEEILKRQDKEFQLDSIWAYFNEEYLNPANDKTSGSIGMVASNLMALFIHPPFSNIFKANGTFNFNNAIDEGKIVYLDMPTALYGKAATCAALCMKIDFFRAMLSRPRLRRRNPDGTLDSTLVDQMRPMAYFCDEFASVVSVGNETGEAGFMDKVREFRCACLLGVQSMPMLLKKMEESETDAILTNTALKIFLRNTDQKTNKFASDLMGTEIKVNASINQSATHTFFDSNKQVGQRAFQTNHSKNAKFEIGDFTKLQKGEAIVAINPRFGKNQIQRVKFKGKGLDNIDKKNLYPVPGTDTI